MTPPIEAKEPSDKPSTTTPPEVGADGVPSQLPGDATDQSGRGALALRITRVRACANSEPFKITPIRELLDRRLTGCEVIIDPFARNSEIGTIRNDWDPDTKATFHMDAEHFGHFLVRNRVIGDAALFDPPYSPRQIKEHYQRIGITKLEPWEALNTHGDTKDLFAQVLRVGGITISFGWNSNGFGTSRGFRLEEVMIVAHGGARNDTIVTVERKIRQVQLAIPQWPLAQGA